MAANDRAGPGQDRAGILLLTVSLSSFLTPFMASAVNLALPGIGRDFDMGAVALGWVPSSYLLSAAAFLLPFGRIADIIGRRRIFLCGLGIFILSSLASAVSPNASLFLISRTIQGLGSAMVFGTGTAILVGLIPPEGRGRALGINVAATYLGLSLGPYLGGLLVGQLGWRSIFIVVAAAGTAALGFAITYIDEDRSSSVGGWFNPYDSLLYGASLCALMLGLSQLPQGRGVALLVAGVLGLVIFLRFEAVIKSPALDLDLFRGNPAFTYSNLAALINYCATSAVGFLLSLYLQYLKGLSPQRAGLVLISQPVVMALFSPLAGLLSDRIQPRILASAGMAVTTVGLAALALMDKEAGLGSIAAALVVLGFGFALFSSPNTNAVMSAVDQRRYGVASAVLGTMRLLGQMLSMGLVMLLFSLFIGPVLIQPANYPQFLASFRAALWLFSVLCLAGTFASLARGRMPR